MTNTNPLEGLVSICCGVQHDINAEYTIDNEDVVGGCCSCKRYAEFIPAEEFAQRKRGVINRLAFA